MSDKASDEKKQTGGKGKLSGVLLIVVFVALGVMIKTTVILLMLGLMPSIVAWYVDMMEGRPRFRVVFTTNLSGVAPYVVELVSYGNQPGSVIQMMTNPSVWFIMYFSAAVGWLLVWGCPHMMEFCMEFSNGSKLSKLENLQKKLEEEWGPEIKRSQIKQ